ncbi:MAG TPA: formate dehydrogenase accessory sulfurtransferase FdhD [Burkholderiales bacterium]|nr:formate dehydrogenase accessory sulfurtransferase FdhD [Burkholderiales bacterium]
MGAMLRVAVGSSCGAYPVERRTGNGLERAMDLVAEEVPVALSYNGTSYAVMLATPHDLEDFAAGFSLSEAIVGSIDELHDLQITRTEEGIAVDIAISPARFFKLRERRRNLTGRTGCGICGTESLAHAIRRPPPVASPSLKVRPTAIHRALAELGKLQTLNSATGAVHAAAWASAGGAVRLLREDVGRHNALDKLIGSLAWNRSGFADGFAVITSRASYEMVQKAATAGIALVAAISAPTGLAIRLARETGVTLVGFARQRSHVVYTHSQRIHEISEAVS